MGPAPDAHTTWDRWKHREIGMLHMREVAEVVLLRRSLTALQQGSRANKLARRSDVKTSLVTSRFAIYRGKNLLRRDARALRTSELCRRAWLPLFGNGLTVSQ